MNKPHTDEKIYSFLSGIWPAISSNKFLFSLINKLMASFHALFMGSLSNLSLANALNFCRSSLNTVADVLTSSCAALKSGFVFSAIMSPPIYCTSFVSHGYLLFSHSINNLLKINNLHKKHKIFIPPKIKTQITQSTQEDDLF